MAELSKEQIEALVKKNEALEKENAALKKQNNPNQISRFQKTHQCLTKLRLNHLKVTRTMRTVRSLTLAKRTLSV